MIEKQEQVKEKLTKENISFKEIISEEPEEYHSKLLFEIPAGREKHECMLVYSERYLNYATDCEFEKFRFIQGYEAVWSKEKNLIEAEVSSPELLSHHFMNRLHKFIVKSEASESDEDDEDITEISFPDLGDIKINLGFCTKEFSFITGCRERGLRRFNARKVTLKISSSNKATHDSSKELLEKIANSIFFQIDLAFEIPINLQSQKETFAETRKKRQRKQLHVDRSATITQPKFEYDSEPISLYWYAKESSNMPIFQYLAFYQSLEFYFPIYSSIDAKQKIQSIIKDPRFNPNKDTDITKIISTIRSTSAGKSFGSERDQLRSTVNACTNNIELRSFFQADDNRFNFYFEHKGKGLAEQKISVKNETSDLILEVSERIYQLRCRIVHSKASENDSYVLLPYSAEIKNLNFDIELIEFIARKVLITSSRSLTI